MHGGVRLCAVKIVFKISALFFFFWKNFVIFFYVSRSRNLQ